MKTSETAVLRAVNEIYRSLPVRRMVKSSELAEKLSIPINEIHNLLDSLEGIGLVRQEKSGTSPKTVSVELTEKGRKKLD